MKKRGILLVLVGLLAIGGIIMFPKLFSKSLYQKNGEFRKDVTLKDLYSVEAKHGELLDVFYSHGGGMNGETYYNEIAYDKDGNLIGEKGVSAAHYIPIRVYRYRLDPQILQDCRRYIDEYNLSVWEKLPFDDEFIVLDGPSTHIRLVFDDSEYGGYRRESCNISYEDVIPEGGYEILNGFATMIGKELKEENLYETCIKIDGKDVYTGRDIENSEEEIRAFLMGYWRSIRQIEGETVNEFDDDQFYWFDFSFSDEVELCRYGSDEVRRTYVLDSILQEPLEDYDSSWRVTFTEKGSDTPERLEITVAGDLLYMERSYRKDGGQTHMTLVFRRHD